MCKGQMSLSGDSPPLMFLPTAHVTPPQVCRLQGVNYMSVFSYSKLRATHFLTQNVSCIVLAHNGTIQKFVWFNLVLSLVLSFWLGKCYCGITQVLSIKLLRVFNSSLPDLEWHKLKQNLAPSISHVLKINPWNAASLLSSSDTGTTLG